MSEYYLSDSTRQQLEQEVRELRQREGRLTRNVKKLRAQVQDLTATGGGSYHRLKADGVTVGYRQTVNQYWDVSKDEPAWSCAPVTHDESFGLTDLPFGLKHGDRGVEGQEGRHLKRMGKPSNNPTGK
jgi:hypothetical protein